MEKLGKQKIKARDIIKEAVVEVELTGLKKLQLRVWVALRLIKLAAWIMGCQIKVTEDERAKETTNTRTA